MWPRSSRFDGAVVHSHEVAIHVALWSPGQRDLLADDLDVVGGSVTASRTATHRRSALVDLVDRDGTLARLFADDRTVRPYELVVKRGIRYPGGAELLPLGVLPVAEAKTRVFPSGAYSLTCYDRSRRVSRNTFRTPYVVQPGTAYVAAAAALVRDRLPFPVEVLTATTRADTTPGPIVYMETDDPWATATRLAAAAGCELFFDQIGRLVIRDLATGLGDPVWTYDDGETSILLPDTERTISDDPGYNAVLAIGESSANESSIPRVLVYDDDPRSPTYAFGDYGFITEVYSSSTVTDPDRAELVARGRLRHWLGANDTMTLATVPHPAHDPGDVVRVAYGTADRIRIVDGLTMPLDVESAASLTLRAQVEL